MLKLPTFALISHASKLQQYVNHELPDVQAGFRKGRGTRDQKTRKRLLISWLQSPSAVILEPKKIMSDTCRLFPPLETPGLPACYPLNSFPSKEQVSFNFMAAITICSDSGAQKNKVSHCFHCFPIYLHEVVGPDALILVFWMLSFRPTFSLSSFTFIKRLFSSSSLSAIRVVLGYTKILRNIETNPNFFQVHMIWGNLP